MNRDAGTTVEILDARKRFGDRVALDGLSLRISVGEWVGLVGPNGAGKTTLMRAIAGLIDLDDGSVAILGERMSRSASRPLRSRLGVVPQEIALYPLLTARENLDVFGRLHGVPRGELGERVAWALDWTALARRADERVAGFSGGMQRRLNIACGVLHRPRVVLLDEPTVGVDPHGRHRIQEMLRGLCDAGTSLLQSSHQLQELEQSCERMVIVDSGRVLTEGSSRRLSDETPVGARSVTLKLDRNPPAGALGPGLEIRGHVVTTVVHDVAAELPAILERIREAGLRIDNLRVEPSSLEEVFLELTGRELRE